MMASVVHRCALRQPSRRESCSASLTEYRLRGTDMTPSCHGTFAPAASAQRFCELLPQADFWAKSIAAMSTASLARCGSEKFRHWLSTDRRVTFAAKWLLCARFAFALVAQ